MLGSTLLVVLAARWMASSIVQSAPFSKLVRSDEEAQVAKTMQGVASDPVIQARVLADPRMKDARTREQRLDVAKKIGSEFALRGLALLSGPDLVERNRLLATMSEQDVSFCAGLWTGGLPQERVFKAVQALPPRDRESFASIAQRAARLGAESTPSTQAGHTERASPEEGALGEEHLEAVSRSLPEAQRARFDEALMRPLETMSDDEACFLMKSFMLYAMAAPRSEQEAFLRALAKSQGPD